MCLAVPAKVVSMEGGSATVSIGGVRKVVRLDLVDGIREGDFVLLHTGFALARLDPIEAEKTLALLRETARASGSDE